MGKKAANKKAKKNKHNKHVAEIRRQSYIGKNNKFNEFKFSFISRLKESLHFSKNPKQKAIYISGILALLVAFTGVGLYFNTTTVAAYVVLDGHKLGFVSGEAAGNKLIDEVLTDYGNPIGEIGKYHGKIEFENVRVKKKEFAENKLTKETLKNNLDLYVDGYTFEVNGKTLAMLPSKDDVDNVIQSLKDYYAKPKNKEQIVSVDITDKVSSTPLETQPDKVEKPSVLLEQLKKGQQEVKEYVVQPNDSLWLIARKNNMLTDEVIAGNKGMTEDSVLQPGDKIKIVSVEPYITVVSKGEYTAQETIPFDVITKTDYSLGNGQTRVKQQGSDGSKIVTYNFVAKNGIIVEKNVTDEEILSKPVDQVVAKGPNRGPAVYAYNAGSLSRGSGISPGLQWPIRGPITSYYGYRSRGFHHGIDIDGVTGQPIAAAAAGTVVFSGWSGSYGYMVLVDHGNGIATRYAHASKLLVSVGKKVSKGQTIALVGSTGNSTGSHLHFEVIVNGNNVNPLNYLP